MSQSRPESAGSTQPSDPSAKGRRPGTRLRRWTIRFLIAAAVTIPIGLWILNGPGFRALATYAAKKGAASQGLEGDLEIRGTLWSGFTLSDARFEPLDSDTGEASAQPSLVSLALDEATLSYRALPLIFDAASLGWLDLVRVDTLEVSLRLPPDTAPVAPESEEEEPEAPETDPSFSPIWNLLATAEIDINEVAVSIEQGDRRYAFEGIALASNPDESGRFAIRRAALPDRDPFDEVAVTIETDEREITLSGLDLGESARISSLRLAEPEPGAWTAAVEGLIGGGALRGELTRDGTVSLILRDGTQISLPDAVSPFAPDLPVAGRITDLDLRFANALEAPARWTIEGHLVGSGLGWDSFKTNSIALAIRDQAVTLELIHPELSLVARASAPLDRAETYEDLSSLTVDASARATVKRLGALVETLGADLPLSGALSLDARDFRFDTAGNVLAGNLLLEGADVSWDGLPVSTWEVAATVERENLIRLGANAGLDADSHFSLRGDFQVDSLAYEAEARLHAKTRGVLGRWLSERAPATPDGTAELTWEGAGTIAPAESDDAPAHRGNLALDLSDFAFPDRPALSGAIRLSHADASAELSEFRLTGAGLTLSGQGGWDGETVRLSEWSLRDEIGHAMLSLDASAPFDPSFEGDFLDQTAPLHLDLALDRLAPEAVAKLFSGEPPLAGRVDGAWKASGSFRDLELKGALAFRPSAEDAPEDAIVDLEATLAGDTRRPASWRVDLRTLLSGFRWRDTKIEDITLTAATRESANRKHLAAALRANQSGATLSADARLDLAGAEDWEALGKRPLAVEATVDAPDLASLWRDWAPPKWRGIPVSGALKAEVADLRLAEGSVESGTVSIASDTLTLEDETFERIALDAHVTRPDRVEATLAILADDHSRVEGEGFYDLAESSYDGTLSARLDLAKDGLARRLLADRNLADMLPRRTELTATARGVAREGKTAGTLRLDAADLGLATGAAPIRTIRLDGDFSLPGRAAAEKGASPDVSATLRAESDPLDLEGAFAWKEGRVTLSDWSGSSRGMRVLSLSGSLPLDADGFSPESWFAREEGLALALDVDALDFETVYRLVGRDPPLRGRLDLAINATGTPANPSLDVSLEADGLSVTGESGDTDVGRIELTLDAAGERAKLSGAYRHPEVNPLVLGASLPFHPRAWALGERKIPEETLEATARMDRSSLAFLPGQVPAIESVEGVIGLDARVGGTIGKPSISGSGVLDVRRLRLASRDAPSFYDIDLAARFADNRLTIDRLYAIVAGGEIEGAGTVAFPVDGEPLFDLGVQGSEVLIYRNPDVSLRTDVDLNLTGPWSEARIVGELGIVNSRFFKNFDLIPGAVPIRRESAVPTVERTPRGGGAAYTDLDVGVDIEPFRNWNADIRIYTKTPFQVRGNLVESDLVADLHIGGKLAAPAPDGHVAIDEGDLSLPFSSIDVEIGRVEFDEKTGFNGALEFRARAKADRYRINVYLYNRVLDPKYVLTSIPPKPEEDLITLLATGSTRDELVSEDIGSVAASKAATLLFKNMRKASAAADREPTVLDELQNRTELEIAGVNPETGEHTIGGKIRLWKQLFFVGNVDAQSDYRATLMYLFRFR